ncbi:MAG: hypothetical protein IJX28_02840 [Clostridia bacterium]|nr:hypothetical protein [Clostridia bacterium]
MKEINITEKLSIQDLRALSQSARIALDETEEPYYLESVNAMLALAMELEELPMHTGAYPAALTLEEMREDVPAECGDRRLLLEQSAHWEQGYFTVPRVMEKQI